MLLSPGHLNQETIVCSSEAFHLFGSLLFSLIAFTLFFAFSYCCFLFSIACNSACSLFLVCSNTLSWILPSDKSTTPALKATPEVILMQVWNTSILCVWIASTCSVRARFKALYLILLSTIRSITVFEVPASKFKIDGSTFSLPCSSANW